MPSRAGNLTNVKVPSPAKPSKPASTPLMPKMAAVQKSNTPAAIRASAAHPARAAAQASRVKAATQANSRQASAAVAKIPKASVAQQRALFNAGLPHHSGGFLASIGALPIVHDVVSGANTAAGTIANTVGDLAQPAVSAFHGMPKIVQRGIADVAMTPVTMAESGLGAFKAVGGNISDILAGKGVQNTLEGHNPTSDFAQAAFNQSAPVEAVKAATGDKQAAQDLKTQFTQHPFNTAAQFVGPFGVAGRLAGAGMRTGALGDAAAARAALTKRTPIEVAPGVFAKHSLNYSKNQFSKEAQMFMERHPAPALIRHQGKALGMETFKAIRPGAGAAERLRVVPALNAINKHTDALHNSVRAVAHARVMGMADPFQAAIQPLTSRLARENMGHVLNGEVTHPELARAQFENIKSSIIDSARGQTAQAQGLVKMNKGESKAAGLTLKRVNELLHSPNFDSHVAEMFAAKPALHDIIHGVDQEQFLHGVRPLSQLERRAAMVYSMTHMGARDATAQDFTPGALAHKDAIVSVRQQEKALRTAQREHIQIMGFKGMGAKLPEDRAVIKATAEHAAALRAEVGKREFAHGKIGMNPALSARRYDILERAQQRTHAAADALDAAKAEAAATHAHLREQAKNNMAAAKDALTEAQKREQSLRGFKGKTYKGQVFTDPRDGETRAVSLQAMKEHMANHPAGPVDHLAYLSARTPAEETLANMGRFTSRGDTPGHRFTGNTISNGAWDASVKGIANSLGMSIQNLEHAKGFDTLISQLNIAKDKTPEAAREIAAEWERQNPGLKAAILTQHAKTLDETQQSLIRGKQGDAGSAYFQNAALDARHVPMSGEHGLNPDERVAVVPQQAVERIKAHAKVDSMNNFFTHTNRLFRNAVLPTSTKWVVGNTTEAALRLALTGAGAGDRAFASKFLKGMTPKEKQDYLAFVGARGARNFGHTAMENEGQGAMSMHNEGTALTDASQQAATKRTVQINRIALNKNWKSYIHVYRGYRTMVFKANRAIEHQAELTALGSHLKDQLHEFNNSMGQSFADQQAYLDAFRKDQATPAMAEQAAARIHDILGKYDGFSPGLKRTIKTIAPFMPWYLNSIKFIYHTMPAHHPMTTAASMAIAHVDRNYVNPDYKTLPGNSILGGHFGGLPTSLKVGPDAYLNLSRFFPTGAFTDSGPIGTANAPVLPYLAPAWQAYSSGKDVFGQTLRGPNGTVAGNSGTAAGIGLSEALSAILAPARLGEKILLGKGRTEYNTSTMWDPQFKPNTAHGKQGFIPGLERVVDPFRPTYLNPQSGSTSSATNGLPELSAPSSGGGLPELSLPGR